MQNKLTEHQIKNFQIDVFVRDQISDFKYLFGEIFRGKNVVDIGGGIGLFAEILSETLGVKVRMIDADYDSVKLALSRGINAQIDDALSPKINGNENLACFNLILHHLVASTESETFKLQRKALTVWRPYVDAVFVNEYVYESFFKDLSTRLIYEITKNTLLSKLCSFIAKFFPSLKANTFGVGVRFRSLTDWYKVFKDAGFDVVQVVCGDDEYISWPRKILLIKKINRISFYLKPNYLTPLGTESRY